MTLFMKVMEYLIFSGVGYVLLGVLFGITATLTVLAMQNEYEIEDLNKQEPLYKEIKGNF